MTFIVDKCKVLNFGSRNSDHTYYMRRNPLQVAQEESDLGVTISSDLNRQSIVKKAYNKANTMRGFI